MKRITSRWGETIKQTSRWAKKQPVKARTLLFLLRVLRTSLAVFAGYLLVDLGGEAKTSYLMVPAAIGLLAILLYPAKRGWATWKRRKLCDGVLVFAGLAIWMGIGMFCQPVSHGSRAADSSDFSFGYDVFAAKEPERQSLHTPKLLQPAFPDRVLDGSPVLLENLEDPQVLGNVRQDPQDRQLSPGFDQNRRMGKLLDSHRPSKSKKESMDVTLKVILFIGAVLFAVVAGYFVAVLACTIACNGLDFLAILVLIAGWGGLLVGLVFLGRHLFRRANL